VLCAFLAPFAVKWGRGSSSTPLSTFEYTLIIKRSTEK
jgi:hypothetical protein